MADGKDKDGMVHTHKKKSVNPENKIQTSQNQHRHIDYRLLLVH